MDYFTCSLFLFACLLHHSSARQHIIRLTSHLQEQGLQAEVHLGAVVEEQEVTSAAECGRLCQQNTQCGSVMLMGNVCRMFAYVHECPMTTMNPCPPELHIINTTLSSRYLVFDPPTGSTEADSFNNAMTYCLSKGGYSVAIDSQDELDALKEYILMCAPSCVNVWTGGKTSTPGDAAASAWYWHYDLTGNNVQQWTFVAWGTSQPGNKFGNQDAMVLTRTYDFAFNDIWMDYTSSTCVLCEANP